MNSYEIRDIVETVSDADYREAVLSDNNARDAERLSSVSIQQCAEWYAAEGKEM
ncbi:MAG: hypothetical protein IJT82_01380 [Schwartzia sp.]|nr:hypothetical protein [Schwartzia sp. (in: firmicutes)]